MGNTCFWWTQLGKFGQEEALRMAEINRLQIWRGCNKQETIKVKKEKEEKEEERE